MPVLGHVSILIVVLVVAIIIVTRWRTVVRLLTAVVATAVITALGVGLIFIWQTAHHAMN